MKLYDVMIKKLRDVMLHLFDIMIKLHDLMIGEVTSCYMMEWCVILNGIMIGKVTWRNGK